MTGRGGGGGGVLNWEVMSWQEVAPSGRKRRRRDAIKRDSRNADRPSWATVACRACRGLFLELDVAAGAARLYRSTAGGRRSWGW